MLYEFAFTPDVFCLSNEGELKHILNQISRNGMIADLNKSKWSENVANILVSEDCTLRNKKFFQSTITYLKKNHRLVRHKRSLAQVNIPEECLKEAIKENSQTPICLIGSTDETITTISSAVPSNVIKISDFSVNANWINATKQSVLVDCTKNGYKSKLKGFLNYAKHLTIIDPFFCLEKRNCTDFFNVCLDCLGRANINSEKNEIKIHTRGTSSSSQSIQQIINNLSTFKIDIYYWNNTIINMHDRYLLTEQAGLSIPRGCEIMSQQRTAISIMDNNDAAEIWNKYNNNDNYEKHIKNY